MIAPTRFIVTGLQSCCHLRQGDILVDIPFSAVISRAFVEHRLLTKLKQDVILSTQVNKK